MHLLKSLAPVFGLLALANALIIPKDTSKGLVIPKDTPDGVYSVHENAAGKVILTKLSDLLDVPLLESRDVSPRNTLQKRDTFDCFPHTLVSNDIQRAAYNLGQTCDSGVKVPKRGAQTAISGQAVVYACNTARYTTHYCSSNVINGVVDYLEQKCPTYRAGAYRYSNTPQGNDVRGYGYDKKGSSICYGHTA